MSPICGIEIKGTTAFLVVLEGKKDAYRVMDTSPSKIELSDETTQESIKSFFDQISDFFKKNAIETVYLKEGNKKGKFQSGASVFKMEALIQLGNANVQVIKSQTLTTYYKKNEMDLETLSLKKYQQGAFQIAYYMLKS